MTVEIFSNMIYYVNDSWYSDIDGESPSEYALLGHELDHAWREHNFQIRFYKGEITNSLYLEKTSGFILFFIEININFAANYKPYCTSSV